MRIMIAYPGHALSTFDVALGYENAFRRLGHEVDGYYYHARLSFYDVAINAWKKRNPDFKAGAAEKFILASEPIAIEAIDFVPDVVIVVNGMALHWRALRLLKSLKIPTVLLLTESPYRDFEQVQIARDGSYDAVLTNDRVSVERLREETGVPVEYLPHSYDPARHFPQDVPGEYRSDVYFFGTWWPERLRLFGDLPQRQNGYRFNVDGPQLRVQGANIPSLRSDNPNVKDNSELVKHYSGTRIALNHHRTIVGKDSSGEELHVEEAYSLGPRAFEIAACGAFQLSDNKRQELGDVFGDSVATYEDKEDLLSKIDYFLSHDAERREMAFEAHSRVQSCTFDKRAEEVVIPLIENIL